jgi:hypothetical protein
MKAHSIDQTAAWAKSWNIRGFEHLYPENRDKARQYAVRQWNENNRDKLNYDKNSSSNHTSRR